MRRNKAKTDIGIRAPRYVDDRRLCRICRKNDRRRSMITYSTRCYAHPHCYTDRHGFDALVQVLAPHRIWQLERYRVSEALRQRVLGRINKLIGTKLGGGVL